MDCRAACFLITALLALANAAADAATQRTHPSFDIRAQSLADALDRFGEQSGLQIVYDQSVLRGQSAPHVRGAMPANDAIEKLLAGSGLTWAYVNENTVLVRGSDRDAPGVATADGEAHQSVTPDHGSSISTLSVIRVTEDPRRILPNAASESSFGFQMPLLETPRSVSFISEETIDLFGLSAVEDLVRVVPGVFTTTRFGIQGAVDVRNVPADTYFRGMRRLSLQGHGRSVLAAMDTIEIVGGPPSPLYGMGKIGGYTNLTPKSGRAQTGAYLADTQGFAQLIGGDYSRREFSFGVGGPLSIMERFDRKGGYYVYGLLEDSDSYAAGVPIRQKVLQAATSIDNFLGPFRLETGVNYQVSRTAGALTGRFTQDLVDNGRYIRGTPLVNLDVNGNGAIGYYEMQRGSPVAGSLSPGNQPLMQTWAWPRDANGRPLPLDQIPARPGIPQAMYDYLVAHPEADPTGLLRAQGPGGPLPLSGSVPIGMVLDPRTVHYDTLDLRRAAAFEKEVKAEFTTLFFDLIDDTNPHFTIKNQFFFDSMDQYKNSNQPVGREQDVYVLEDKLTLTRRIDDLPRWLRLEALVSLNARLTVSEGKAVGGDFSSHRTDAMAPTWVDSLGGMTPNTTFVSPIDHPDLNADGYPWTNAYRTEFTELGAALLFDIELYSKTKLLAGVRIDGSEAQNIDYAGTFNATSGTASNPGVYRTADEAARAWDSATSWSVSLSRELPYNIWPYVTWSRSSILLDGNNNALSNETIEAGHIGRAELKEIGVKASLFDDRLFMAASAFEQARIGVDADDENELIFAYATATNTRGWAAELKWVPTRNLFLSFWALNQTTRFEPNVSTIQLVDARTLGFQDVVDAQGNVIYPAEAFLYGGRSRIAVPAGMKEFEKKQGNPETQLGLSGSYQWRTGVGVTVGANYFSSTCTGLLCVVEIPDSYVANAGLFVDMGRWSLKLDVSNLFDERHFRARTGDTLGNPLAQALPDRWWQFTAKAKF